MLLPSTLAILALATLQVLAGLIPRSTEYVGISKRDWQVPEAYTPPTDLITNGDFEDLSSPAWYTASSPAGTKIGQLYAKGPIRSTSAYNSSTAYQIAEHADKVDTGSRSLCVSQNITFPRPGAYLFSAYIGRIANPGPNQASSTDDVQYAIFVDDAQVDTGRVCNPSVSGDCAFEAKNGNRMYNSVSARFRAKVGDEGAVVSMCAQYASPRKGVQDEFLVDEVKFVGPNRGG